MDKLFLNTALISATPWGQHDQLKSVLPHLGGDRSDVRGRMRAGLPQLLRLSHRLPVLSTASAAVLQLQRLSLPLAARIQLFDRGLVWRLRGNGRYSGTKPRMNRLSKQRSPSCRCPRLVRQADGD